MSTEIALETRPSWTWADQVSTYRFWGLLIFYILAVTIAGVLVSSFQYVFLEKLGLDYSVLALLQMPRVIAPIFGFFLGWAAARWKAVLLLILFAALELVGVVLIFVPGAGTGMGVRFVGTALFGLGLGAATLAVPAILAGGRGGAEAFLIAFGILTTMGTVGSITSTAVAGLLYDAGLSALVPFGVPIVVGVLFLLPVSWELFRVPPPPRGYARTPTNQEPVSAGLLCLIPFYWLYWLYKAHGEVTAVAPTRSILSPRGAVAGALLVPFLYLVEIVSLIDALNVRAAEQEEPPLRSPWVVCLSGLLLFPLAAGLVQAAINDTAARADAGTAPAPEAEGLRRRRRRQIAPEG